MVPRVVLPVPAPAGGDHGHGLPRGDRAERRTLQEVDPRLHGDVHVLLQHVGEGEVPHGGGDHQQGAGVQLLRHLEFNLVAMTTNFKKSESRLERVIRYIFFFFPI